MLLVVENELRRDHDHRSFENTDVPEYLEEAYLEAVGSKKH